VEAASRAEQSAAMPTAPGPSCSRAALRVEHGEKRFDVTGACSGKEGVDVPKVEAATDEDARGGRARES
jgi:hypothetical protein